MKDEVMDRVLKGLIGVLEPEQVRSVSNSMLVVFNDYKIERITQEVMEVNDEWKQQLEMFLVSKMVEGKSSKTVEQYSYELKQLLGYLNKDVANITDDEVFGYIAKYKSVRKVSNQTLENKRLVYSSFFSWLHNRGKIVKNPMLSISTIKCEQRIKQPFSDEERQRIFDACLDNREKALVEFLYSTCVRVGELVQLNKNDIDFREKELIVYGKGNKERTVYLNAKASMYLKRYLDLRGDNSDALFASQRIPNDRITKGAVEAILKRIGKRAGVENVHPHRFRRTGATNALNKGMSLQEVSIMLGHVKLDTTRIYCTTEQESVKYSHRKYMGA